MIALPAGTRIWIAAGVTYMRRGFDGLAVLVQTQLEADPFSGQIFAFRGRRGDHRQRGFSIRAIQHFLLWKGIDRVPVADSI
jgi:transposase